MMKIALAAVVAFTLSAAPASAATTVGASNGPNSYPFGNFAGEGGVRFQQVFNSSAFNGLTTFDSISLFKDAQAFGTGDAATYTISFSLTNKSSTTLASSFASNITSPQSLFGSFSTSALQPNTLTFVGNQFIYNPTLGNLLMDVTVSNLVSFASGYAAYQADYGTGQTARIYGFNTQSGTYAAGAPVVRFDLTSPGAVPEPATWAMMILGMGAVGFAMRRRSKVNTTVRFA